MTDPAALRADYTRGNLDEADVADAWYPQLRLWFDTAAGDPSVLEPNAVQLATADASGRPSVRTVLAKALDERGLIFYTNYDSAKGRALAANPRASAAFVWLGAQGAGGAAVVGRAPQRQVRLTGAVRKVDRDETEAYFASRPRESQIGAWASPQSEVVESRAALDAMAAEVAARFGDDPIPAPPHWGGYLVEPDEVEFWQGRQGRMHDRIRYRRGADEAWVRERLGP